MIAQPFSFTGIFCRYTPIDLEPYYVLSTSKRCLGKASYQENGTISPISITSNSNLDISHDIVNLEDGTADLQFWGVRTPNRSGQHQSLTWCNPRFLGRGDNSVYNRPFIGLKTIMAVVGGFLNSLIAKTSINHSIFYTFFGDQNSWSLAIFNCFRPFCFNLRGSSRG